MITISFTNGCVAQFRASGTEPKFKYYVEMAGKPGVQRSQVEEELNVMVDKVRWDFFGGGGRGRR